MKAKRQTTRWLFTAAYQENTHIRIGYIYNKSKGVKEDVVRVQIMSATENGSMDFACRIDEATVLAAGLNKVTAQMLLGQLPIPRVVK